MPFYLFSNSIDSFSLFIVAILEGLAIHIWRYRREPGARWMVALQACKGACLFFMALGCASQTLTLKIAFLYIQVALSVVHCYCWFRFLASLSGFDRRLSPWILRTLDGIAAISCLLILTNRWHGALWTSFRMDGEVLLAVQSFWGNAVLAVIYSMAFLTAGMNIVWAQKNVGLRRRQAWIFLVPSLITLLARIVSALLGPEAIAPQALGFGLSSLVTIWAFHRWRLYSILPLAYESITRNLQDGLMVIDNDGYIVEMNQSARQIFCDSSFVIGRSFETGLAQYPALAGNGGSADSWEAPWARAGEAFRYRITSTALYGDSAHLLGRVLLFRDITEETRQHACMVEQEKALAILSERERMGRELHDGRGQAWSYVSLTAQMLRTLLTRKRYEQAEEELDRLIGAVQQQHTAFRETIHNLRATMQTGLVHTLEQQLDWYRKNFGLEVELVVSPLWQPGVLAADAEVQLMRIVQESMVNIRKSAQARRVRVSLEVSGSTLRLCVQDDGRGFNVQQALASESGHGLCIMRERADAMQAKLLIDSRPGDGTRVEVLLPLSHQAVETALQ